MEEWQINHINSNLSSLIKNTRCTTNFMAILKEKELITDEDSENLLDLRKRAAASQLYEILKTRLGGYDGLIEALKLDRQTGAWKTLISGEEAHFKSPENLEKQIQQLLNLPVQFNDRVSLLKDIFPEFKTQNATEILRQTYVNRDFHHIMAQQSTVLCLDDELPQSHPLYVSRSISNRLVLNPSVFRLKCNDIFVFKGVERNELLNMVHPHVTRSSSDQLSRITSRHIHLDEDEDWDDLVLVAKSPIHLIEKEREEYVFLRSNKVSSTINAYVDTSERSKSGYISEDTFVDQLSSEEKGALICDFPGMGKSWLMESLARKLRATLQHGKNLVFFIKLSEFSLELCKLLYEPKNHNTLQFIFEYVGKSKLTSHILKELIHITGGLKAVFFLDGFDEVNDLHVKKTTTFLEKLNCCKNVKIVISSRPNMRSHLEQTFNLISYDILPFDEQDQIGTIIAIWQQSLSNCKHGALKGFASKCIVSIKRLHGNDTREILGVPLRCYLLAVIHEKRAERLSKLQEWKAMKITDEAAINSISDLYDKFVEVSLLKVASEKRGIIWSLHTLRALEILFPEIVETYKESQKLQNDSMTSPELMHVGLLWQTHQFRPEFLHRSFAEYFVGKFLADFWINMSSLDPCYVEETGSHIVDKVLKMSVEGMDDTLMLFLERIKFGNNYRPGQIWSQFQSSPIMMFMNAIDIRAHKTTKEMQSFKQLLETKGVMGARHVKESIRKHIYISMIHLLAKRLFSVFELILGVVKVFFKETEISDLLMIPYAVYENIKDTYSPPYEAIARASIPLILYYVSYSGSPEAVNLLFGLFGNLNSSNYLIRLCQGYPLKYWSPLEIAITTNDIDMFMYFSNKMKLPMERLLVRCLLLEEFDNGSKTNVDRRILMFKAVLDHLSMPHAIIMEDFKEYLGSLSKGTLLHQWLQFLIKNKISLRMFPFYFLRVFEFAEQSWSDEEIIWFWLVSFKKPRNPVQVASTNSTIRYTTIPQIFRAEDVLQQLDLKKARRKMKRSWNFHVKLPFDSNNVEILRIYLGLFPSLAPFDVCKWDYLHFAVSRSKLEWVKYLIQCGQDVNKQSDVNDTPLFYIFGERPVEMMRLLVENGADVNVVNTSKETFAHLLIERKNLGIEGLLECVNYTLDETEFSLWNVEDKYEITPLDLLEKIFGRSHPTIVAVHAKIEAQGHTSTD